MNITSFSNTPNNIEGAISVWEIGWEDLVDLTPNTLMNGDPIKIFDLWDLDEAIKYAEKKGKFLGMISFDNG